MNPTIWRCIPVFLLRIVILEPAMLVYWKINLFESPNLNFHLYISSGRPWTHPSPTLRYKKLFFAPPEQHLALEQKVQAKNLGWFYFAPKNWMANATQNEPFQENGPMDFVHSRKFGDLIN